MSVAGCYCSRKTQTRVQWKWAMGGMNRDWQKWKWRQKKQEKEVSSPAASGLYFPRHSDFFLATNKERTLCVSMVTPCSSNDREDKGEGKGIHFGLRRNIFLHKFCIVKSISILFFDTVIQKSCIASANDFFLCGKLKIDSIGKMVSVYLLILYASPVFFKWPQNCHYFLNVK